MRIVAIALLLLGLLTGLAGAQEPGSGWLGAELKDLTKEEADALGWEGPRGAKLVKPLPGGPAEAAGLKPGDILVSLDGLEIENVKALVETVRKKTAGADVRIAIMRAGREKRLSLKLGVRPAQTASATPAADGPLPMLDTGGHMTKIEGVAFTPDGGQLVSGSDDKTIRVWDVATGKTLRTMRGQAEPGHGGKIFAMALSPDGKWLVAGGWMKIPGQPGHHIRLYDFASGKLVALLKGHTNVVDGLAFSPNSLYLISGSADKTAIIWDVAARKAVRRLEGHRDTIYAVGFSPDGARAITGSDDHDLRLWSAGSGALLQTMTGHGGQVRSLAAGPDGTIASGDFYGEIRLWDGSTGAFLKTLARQKRWVRGLAFSLDGKALLSGVAEGSGGYDCHVFDTASGREIVSYKGHDNVVIGTAISPDGRWAATGSSTGEIHIWDLLTGVRREGPDGKPLTLGGTGRQVWAAGFSADGRQIGWGTLWTQSSAIDRGPLQRALTLPSANGALSGPQALGAEAARTFSRATARHGAWSLAHRKGGNYGYDAILDISEGGKVRVSIELDTTNGLQHRAYSFTPDGETIVSGGGNGVLSAYALDGKKTGDFIGHEGDIWAVAPSPDGLYLVSGSDDQTVRLWNLKTRELLVTLFQGTDGEWVMWTPQGYYAASGPGSELIGWQINRGPEQEAGYVTAAQLREKLNRPDIVAKAIELASAEEAVRQAHGADFKLADLLKKPVPRFSILSPAENATLRGGSAALEIALEATPDPVKLVRIQVNGRQIAEHQPAKGGGFAPGKLTFDVPLAKGRNTIRVIAVNDTGETPAEAVVTHEGEGDLDKRGTLYILAIGVDNYPNLPGNDLNYSGADAKAFAEAMEKDSGPLHEKVIKRVLVNGAAPGDTPTAANILNALGLLRRAKENDTVMLFVSGHGKNEGPNYRFLPADAAWDEGGFLQAASVVPWYAFQEALTGAGGRRILFLDTCHSGNAFNQKLIGDSYQANIVVYSSARWDQTALEDKTIGGGHGLFTYALVEGVNGAARDASGEIRAEGLRDFLRTKVQELAAKFVHAQEPQYFRARDAENYVLARGR
ncbi:MAG: caspase family protein [Rhodomicrobium sp.]